MAYSITKWALGHHPEISIDEGRFLDLRAASQRHRVHLGLEEKFDLVLANYEEFERDLLSLSLRSLIHRINEWAEMAADRIQLSRRIVNLLSTTRLYADQALRDLATTELKTASANAVDARSLFSQEYDGRLGYRVMEALRNHVQHRTVPIAGISYRSTLDKELEEPLWRFGLALSLDLDMLRSDAEFKKSVLQELETLPADQVDVVLFVRQHIEGIARVHETLREALQPDIAVADVTVLSAIREWEAAGRDPVGLAAVHRDDRGRPVEYFYLTRNLVERRNNLIASNSVFSNLSRRYVSNQRPRANYLPFR